MRSQRSNSTARLGRYSGAGDLPEGVVLGSVHVALACGAHQTVIVLFGLLEHEVAILTRVAIGATRYRNSAAETLLAQDGRLVADF